jgi:hypothetical protein
MPLAAAAGAFVVVALGGIAYVRRGDSDTPPDGTGGDDGGVAADDAGQAPPAGGAGTTPDAGSAGTGGGAATGGAAGAAGGAGAAGTTGGPGTPADQPPADQPAGASEDVTAGATEDDHTSEWRPADDGPDYEPAHEPGDESTANASETTKWTQPSEETDTTADQQNVDTTDVAADDSADATGTDSTDWASDDGATPEPTGEETADSESSADDAASPSDGSSEDSDASSSGEPPAENDTATSDDGTSASGDSAASGGAAAGAAGAAGTDESADTTGATDAAGAGAAGAAAGSAGGNQWTDPSGGAAGGDPSDVAETLQRGIPSLTDIQLQDAGPAVATYGATMAAQNGTLPVDVLTIAPDIPLEPALLERFEAIASQWYDASGHPNVRTLHDWGTDPRPYLTVDGLPSAQTFANARESMQIEQTVQIVSATAEALDAVAQQGGHHLDLSLEAIKVIPGQDGYITVVDDWGLERAVVEHTGGQHVTPYTAPEQLDGRGDARTDVYGLGGVTYAAMTARLPSRAEPASVRDSNITHANEFVQISPQTDIEIMSALAHDPADRHQTPRAYANALSESLW